MKIGIFTDTYFPQISGVATSIKTLFDQLSALGHTAYIFTTTDPNSDSIEDVHENIIRLRSVPFVSMPERRVVMAGLPTALKIAREYDLDIIHTQTEFGVGILGKIVANRLHIPVVHTMHTKYEDYVHYIANGRLIRPGAIKYVVRTFLLGTEAVICPSPMTLEAIENYGIKVPKRVIPTGIELARFTRPDITAADSEKLRAQLSVSADETLLLSLSRLSQEKNIQAVIRALPAIRAHVAARLIIVGDGPYLPTLEKLVESLELTEAVTFAGSVENDEVVRYYKAADFFISASTSETQGLTFTESIAAGTPILAAENPYLHALIDNPQFGRLFASDADIADVATSAIRNQCAIAPALFDKKLYEISAENFGKKVAEFYHDLIIDYHNRPSTFETLTEPLKSATARSNHLARTVGESVRTMPLKIRAQSGSLAQKMLKYVKIDKKKEDEH
ncbi:MAG: glycosyltransferase family 4 protein [Streptococcaceae bacterium]|jgi:1,2-diacylglycerol 3-alpha-glucosyltransferase|nr:glycosyltransferase family 4 protein [Streptococcaceae bacterium]